MLFQNPLFANLNEWMKTVIQNKTNYANPSPALEAQSEAAENNTSSVKKESASNSNANSPQCKSAQLALPGAQKANSFSQKLISIRKMFLDMLPGLQACQKQFFEYLQSDFLLQNFCNADQFRQFFEEFSQHLRTEAENVLLSTEDVYADFEIQLQQRLRDQGKAAFDQVLEKLLSSMQSLLTYLIANKEDVLQHIKEKDPESPLLKRNQQQRKKVDKKKAKDWKSQVLKNKIDNYNDQRGIKPGEEQPVDHMQQLFQQ